MKVEEIHEKGTAVLNEVGKAIVGKEEVLKLILTTILADGHVLLEDLPGLAKTLMAKSFAKALGVQFTRVQFTPDLLPSDILGVSVFNQKTLEFEFRKGPVFTNVLLADEINRAPPKTQSALLEAMEERQVTIEGDTMKLEMPFFVIATQNPIEYEGTYPLPEAQLDRFLLRMSVGYPKSLDDEVGILKARISWGKDDPTADMEPVIDRGTFLEMQAFVEHEVFIHDEVLKYIAGIVREVRKDERVEAGPSPRGALALLKVSKANAMMNGRDFVVPDDVKRYVIDALAHRIVLGAEYAFEGVSGREVVEAAVKRVPVPKEFEREE